jgi:uncharacterized protein (DUF1800 family)
LADELQLSLALSRFGLGAARPGEIATIGADPRGYVRQQVTKGTVPALADRGLTSASGAISAVLKRHMMLKGQLPAEEAKNYDPAADTKTSSTLLDLELGARAALAVETTTPFLERIALFWNNFFVVSTDRPKVGFVAAAYEREALRPHMLGRFEDLLGHAVLHPAMLLYLDNQSSVGPGSAVGRKKGHGLNENLGREVLELHTLGVNGGYIQADVVALAKILSGWRVNLDKPVTEHTGTAEFDPSYHEPGDKVLLGTTYREAGESEIRAALKNLAHHPSTARHVATRIVAHFVASPPPPAIVEAVAARYAAAGGDLRETFLALVDSDEAWRQVQVKLRPPLEFMLATARLIGREPRPPRLLVALQGMGQPYFGATSPKGWQEDNDAWISADGVKSRLDWSTQVADGHSAEIDILAMAERALGPALSAETRSAVAGAESRKQALALLIMSPEFQRR